MREKISGGARESETRTVDIYVLGFFLVVSCYLILMLRKEAMVILTPKANQFS